MENKVLVTGRTREAAYIFLFKIGCLHIRFSITGCKLAMCVSIKSLINSIPLQNHYYSIRLLEQQQIDLTISLKK